MIVRLRVPLPADETRVLVKKIMVFGAFLTRKMQLAPTSVRLKPGANCKLHGALSAIVDVRCPFWPDDLSMFFETCILVIDLPWEPSAHPHPTYLLRLSVADDHQAPRGRIQTTRSHTTVKASPPWVIQTTSCQTITSCRKRCANRSSSFSTCKRPLTISMINFSLNFGIHFNVILCIGTSLSTIPTSLL